jgi:hypothetical protein
VLATEVNVGEGRCCFGIHYGLPFIFCTCGHLRSRCYQNLSV